MKRLNPKTNLPFKYGDVREDGAVFSTYQLTILKKDGFFREKWLSKKTFSKTHLNLIKQHKIYRKNNSNKCNEASRKYRKNNHDKVINIEKKYYLNNKDKIFAKVARRRATKLNATPFWLTDDHKKQIIEIYKNCIEISKQTGVQHHVDHIVPLKGKEVCGLHVPWNLQILTATENTSKNNKLIEH